jgi:hypothetical protein
MTGGTDLVNQGNKDSGGVIEDKLLNTKLSTQSTMCIGPISHTVHIIRVFEMYIYTRILKVPKVFQILNIFDNFIIIPLLKINELLLLLLMHKNF